MERNIELVIIGAGPAGRALAHHASALGLAVSCVDEKPGRWSQRFASWADDLTPDVRAHCVQKSWSDTVMIASGGDVIPLGRPYAVIDNDALMRHLDVPVIPARVQAVTPHRTGSTVHLDDGTSLEATLVVDASGGGHFLDGRSPGTAFQIAWGELRHSPGHGLPLDQMVLMDWRPAGNGPLPSFVYVMALDPDHVFLEETILACRPGVSPDTLRDRLANRFVGGKVLDTERCVIPLDPGMPTLGQRTVGFGAAAGMVHPATGYQVARALAQAPRVASAIAAALPSGPDAASQRAWGVVAPLGTRAARRAHLYGLELLLSFDQTESSSFFQSFFAQPRRHWQSYLDAESGWLATTRAMAGLLASDPTRLPTLIRPLAAR